MQSSESLDICETLTFLLADQNSKMQVSVVGRMISELLTSSILCRRKWEMLSPEVKTRLSELTTEDGLLDELVEQNCLTTYQRQRIRSGCSAGLVIGNYRLLERLGAGGMGIVFKAEHLYIPRPVAIKLIPQTATEDPKLLRRFHSEIWSVAQLQHPNIVGAIDAGEFVSTDPWSQHLHYFVMDYVAGDNLEDHIAKHGPMKAPIACDLIYQVASALDEAHKFQLVHRDIKPSNIMVTPEGQAKLLDFGLVRHSNHRLTDPGTAVGTIDFLSPEQARDASSVDIRADIYSLGATLYWCLTGLKPFPSDGNMLNRLLERQLQGAPSARSQRGDISPELDSVIVRMMELEPEHRYPTPQAAMRALIPFLQTRSAPRSSSLVKVTPFDTSERQFEEETFVGNRRVLLVDDEASVRCLYRHTLQGQGVLCDEAANGSIAWQALQKHRYDLILCDCEMPEMNGLELLVKVRDNATLQNCKIIMFSGRASPDEMAQMLSLGADDYLMKPFSIAQFLTRVNAMLKLKSTEDRLEALNRQLRICTDKLERGIEHLDCAIVEARKALAIGMIEIVGCRDSDSSTDRLCLSRYCKRLAETASQFPRFTQELDTHFISLLECCAPLRDLGLVGIPDHILFKPGPLDFSERLMLQSHTTIGAETLSKMARQAQFGSEFFQMASEVAHYHHEWFDGTGYPHKLRGEAIPLSARIVAIVDSYHALRTRRHCKPALSHADALRSMTETAASQFDPGLWQAFLLCANDFDSIKR